MQSTNSLHRDDQFIGELQSCAKLLAEKLQNDHYEEAAQLIQELLVARDRHLFNAVGRLTRGLHDAIVNFNVDADINAEPIEVNQSEISDASDRLHYVMKLTQEAADKTMDRVESSAPIAMNLGQEAAHLKAEWARLRRRELTKEDFALLYARMGEFLEQMGEGTEQLNHNLQAIILEQGYQDLTGQVLKKVIGLVSDVEKELVNLVKMAGQVEEVAGIANKKPSGAVKSSSEAEGPQIFASEREDAVSSQDEVDDLLSSLGF